jgi:PAS domain S-box-containing protein
MASVDYTDPKTKVNILIVDDREENLLALETLLGNLNHNIIRATSGKDALKQLLIHDFAVILLDVIMPEMDGFETAEIIRQREKSQFIPIIFLTALAGEAQYAFKGYAMGAVDYMAKPIVPEILRAKVKVFIDLYVKNQIMLQQQAELERINAQLTNEIAERKKIENLERLALVASKSFNAIAITDKNGMAEWVNEGFTLLTGYSSAELVGTKGEVVRKDNALYDRYIALVNEKKEPASYEEKHYAKDGHEYHVLITLTPVLTAEGNIDKILIIEADITSQKLTEEKLIEANRKAEEAVKAKQQFLANMSHEIRTPMNAIIGFTKVILKTNLNQKQREYLNAIKLSGDALIVLINDILDLAKVDAGKMTFEHIPFRLSASINAMLRLFEAKIQEKNLELIREYDERIPDILVGDPVRLHQIILNLISNAIKFTSRGHITVKVGIEKETDTEVTVRFSVSDTGIGIPEHKLGDIFDNFQQASSETARIYGGTGLGLAIVQKLVEGQGGTVSVTSKQGEGSTFSIVLTFNRTTDDAQPAVEPGIEIEPDSKNIKVLVVEDIALNQLLMKTLLDEFGFEHELAANGKVAVKKLQKSNYDIVLMDLQMPEMNGFEATEYIRTKLRLEIPIIALTADVTTDDVKKCRSVGMNDYISKPVDERVLYEKIIRFARKPDPLTDPPQEPVVPVVIGDKGDEDLADAEKDETGREKDVSPVIKNEAVTNEQPPASANPAENIVVPHEPAKATPATSPGRVTDLAYLQKHTKGNPDLMREMIRLYVEQTPPLLETMQKAMDEGRWKDFYSAIHKMVPSFWMMGINKEVEAKAKTLKENTHKEEHLDQVPALFAAVKEACLAACRELEEELHSI